MLTYRSLPVLAVRRMLGNWRLLTSIAIGTLAAAAILSSTAVYADAIRDLGLKFAVEHADARTLDVSLFQSNATVTAESYQQARLRQDGIVGGALGPTSGGVVRQASSATFFPTTPGGTVDREDAARLRGNFVFRSDLEEHIRVIEGEAPEAMPDGAEGAIRAYLGSETASRLGIEVGAQYDLFPFWDDKHEPIRVEVAGIAEPLDPESRYWGRDARLIDAPVRSWDTLLFLVPETTFFGSLTERVPTLAADYLTLYEVRLDALNARNATPIADRLDQVRLQLAATEVRTTADTGLTELLRTFDQKLFFTRIPLLVLLLQIGGIVAYYLVMVSTMLIERQAAEIATLRSRGATTGQLLAQYGVEGAILALLAGLTGPPIAAAVISALGPTPAFSALSGGSTLSVHVGGAAYLLAGLGALIAFAALMIPAWRATRETVVEFKRGAARPKPTPLFLRYYLDVALVVVLAIVFWRLSQQEELFAESIFGETRVDPFLLATPAVFMLTVGIVFLRLFPPVLRMFAWAVGWTRSVAILVGMRSLVRNPTHYTRLILLLMFATGVGMFGATFSATLTQSYEDRARFVTGADVRAESLRTLTTQGDRAFLETIAAVPSEAASPLIRSEGVAFNGTATTDLDVLAIEPSTFEDVAYFRDDFATFRVGDLVETLAAAQVDVRGPTLPAGARQLGIWAQFPEIRGRVGIGVSLRGAGGRVSNRLLGTVRPDDEATPEWRFYSNDLANPRSRTGGPLNEQPLSEPIEVLGFYIAPVGQIAAQQGSVNLGMLYATVDEPPPRPADEEPRFNTGLNVATSRFTDAVAVADFSSGEFDVLQGLRPTSVADTLRPSIETPPGNESALRFDWQDRRVSPQLRGIRLRTPGIPPPVYLSSAQATELHLEVGSIFTAGVQSRYFLVQLAGVFDLFPTADPESRGGFMVMDAGRLRAAVNLAIPDSAIRYNEAWFATSDHEATAEALAAYEPATLSIREVVRVEQQDDPLIAAGWSGILAISFGAVLLLSAIGFVVYSYLTAQQRGLEFAILRTLGFSRLQVFGVVLFEHILVIAAGMGLGTVVGLQVGRMMMDFLGTDERGANVHPPFILHVSWPEIFVVWSILGTVFVMTIAAVVALYFRLAVHRALRIGDA